MKLVFEDLILLNVRTGITKDEQVVTYLEGAEVGGFIVNSRIVGKALESELSDLLGQKVHLELSGIDFLNRDGRNLIVRCSEAFVKQTQPVGDVKQT